MIEPCFDETVDISEDERVRHGEDIMAVFNLENTAVK